MITQLTLMENFLDFNFSTKIPVIPLKILTTKSAMRYSMFNKSRTKKLKKKKLEFISDIFSENLVDTRDLTEQKRFKTTH